MSGQWEVVGKKKEKNNKAVVTKTVKEIKNKTIASTISINDVLPKAQIKQLYVNGKVPKEIKKNEKQTNEQNLKKSQKKADKPNEPVVKVKHFKNLESALNSINVDNLLSIYTISKSRFGDAPIVWLKEVLQFFNQNLNVDVKDPIFAEKPIGYPVSVIPKPLKAVIDKIIEEAGKSNEQLFFNIMVTSVVTEMSKGLSCLGHKLLLQYVALKDPSVVAPSMNKYVELRNSYQNRPNIGLSLLWCVGQAGYADPQTALKVFQELMLPLIELKNYSRYIYTYLLYLLPNLQHIAISKEDYLAITNAIFCSKKNCPNDLKDGLVTASALLNHSLINYYKKDKYPSLFDCLLKTISNNRVDKLYQSCLSKAAVECLAKDENLLLHWKNIYSKNIEASGILLGHIEHHWASIHRNLSEMIFNETLDSFRLINSSLSVGAKSDSALIGATIDRIGVKMSKRKSTSSFPWKSFVFVISVLLSIVLYLGITHSENLPDSKSDSLICNYVNLVLTAIRNAVLWVHLQIESVFPGYDKQIAKFSEPYVQLAHDLGLVVKNLFVQLKEAFVKQFPTLVKNIETYAPGIINAICETAIAIWTTLVQFFTRTVVYLKEEVFVGQLSPENIQYVLSEAVVNAQRKTVECYHWIYEKVESAIK